MLTSSGPVNISGNKVSTSIFMLPFPRGEGSTRRLFLNNLQHAAQALFRAAGREQGANGVNRHPLPANDPPDIIRVEAQFVNRQPVAFDWSDGHFVGLFD